MHQRWTDLLFLHWAVDPEVVRASLPAGLTVDTFEGNAYLGIVPFFMRDIRPRNCPAVPGISNFLEMNVRTYAYDLHGRPGVWFYSLDANQRFAVRLARKLFNLPYHDAVMRAARTFDVREGIQYEVHRRGCDPRFDSTFRYAELEAIDARAQDGLEFFLIERYILFAAARSGELFAGRVHHEPYPLRRVRTEIHKEGAIALAGLTRPDAPPNHAVMSPGVDVDVFSIERIR